ncbi:ATP-binding protein [Streptomyces celluloflavus]|uniref:ATP-binding protein n=1 Tax=Streptomyces celluloflavus TaxID=58344 RepID=UPI00368CAD1F
MTKPAERAGQGSAHLSPSAGLDDGVRAMAVMTAIDTRQYRQELIVRPKDLGCIRRIVGAHLRHWGHGKLVRPASMCVTELLSNVHKHAGSAACTLLLQSSPTGVRIVVSDRCRDLPVIREPDWSAESGRGLFLISKTVDAWGASPNPGGKDVWVEFCAVRETVA